MSEYECCEKKSKPLTNSLVGKREGQRVIKKKKRKRRKNKSDRIKEADTKKRHIWCRKTIRMTADCVLKIMQAIRERCSIFKVQK